MNEFDTNEYSTEIISPNFSETLYVKYKLGGWRMMLLIFIVGFVIILGIIISLAFINSKKKKS